MEGSGIIETPGGQSVRVDKKIWEQFVIAAESKGQTPEEAFRQCLDNWIEQHKR